jgi:hypothetical protein
VPLSGYASGSFVKVTVQDDVFILVRGADGTFTRSKKKGRATLVEVRLMQSSDSNAVLTALHEADYLAANGAGIVPFLLRDRGGRSLVSAADAWITKPAEQDFDESAKERVWVFQLVNPKIFVGGN